MLLNLQTSGKFSLAVALPLALVLVALVAFAVQLTLLRSSLAERGGHQYEREIVAAAVADAQRELGNLVLEMSRAEDAVKHFSRVPNADWMAARYAGPTTEGINYDALLVIEPGRPQTVAGMRKGSFFTPDLRDYFGTKATALMGLMKGDGTASAAIVVSTKEGLALAAMRPILRTAAGNFPPTVQPRYLMALQFLTPERVAALGELHALKALSMRPATEYEPFYADLKDFTGTRVAALTWTDRPLADVLGRNVEVLALAALAPAAALVLGIALLFWHLSRAMANRDVAVHRSLRDDLTGLLNRAALHAEIRRLSETSSASLALAFIDLDGFKEINDTYGHETGDALIKAVAEMLSGLGRAIIFRLGGDEFVMLLTGPDARELMHRSAQELIDRLRTPFVLSGKVAMVGASIGIAHAAAAGVEASELMRQADTAMYEAKSDGRNCIREYIPALDADRLESVAVVRELRRILAEGSIDIAYQPIVDSSGTAIVGIEALARLPGVSSHAIDTAQLIRAIELNGLMDELGTAILAKACAAASAWPGLRLAVNVSPVQLRNPDFVSATLRTIAENGMTGDRIELEFPASELLQETAEVKRALAELRKAGIRIALDNFGGRNSSIGHLTQFNFDSIKVDRALIEAASREKNYRGIVQGVIALAAAISADVTANGVETEGQFRFLRQAGCARMQGHYFFKPVPAAEISNILKALPQLSTVT